MPPIDPAASDRLTAEELARVPYEPWLPVETYLVAGSLVVGTLLLGVLLWVCGRYFPVL